MMRLAASIPVAAGRPICFKLASVLLSCVNNREIDSLIERKTDAVRHGWNLKFGDVKRLEKKRIRDGQIKYSLFPDRLQHIWNSEVQDVITKRLAMQRLKKNGGRYCWTGVRSLDDGPGMSALR